MMQTSLAIDELNLKLQAIYEALGGGTGVMPPDPSANNDPLNWWLATILEQLTGDQMVVPLDCLDELAFWFEQYLENMPNGESVVPPDPVPRNDLLEWFFQQVHECYTGDANVRPPESERDDLRWWLDQIVSDIESSPGGVPFRFKLALGELILTGDTLPSFNLNPGSGELTVDESTLPSGYANWRVESGRLVADPTACTMAGFGNQW